MKTTLRHGRIQLLLDSSNEDTPAMVEVGQHASTWDAATKLGVVGTDDQIELSDSELEWLDAQSGPVEQAFNEARANWE